MTQQQFTETQAGAPLLHSGRRAMGCEFEIWLPDEGHAFLRDAASEALDEISRLDEQLSHYKSTSDISYLSATAADASTRVDPHLYELLENAARISSETHGAFDVTIGPLVRLWGFHQGDYSVPSKAAIEKSLRRVGMTHLRFDPEWNAISFDQAGVELNLGAIGKGYAIDRAVSILRELGVENALVHGGGSTIYALGAPPNHEYWTVGLRHPEDPGARIGQIRLRDEALSTSGGYEQFFAVDGETYSHLLDPRTGYPAKGILSASVITASATESDALSTAFFVLGAKGATEYCATHFDIRAVLVSRTGGRDLDVIQIGPTESLEE